jgi:hypothetical protein
MFHNTVTYAIRVLREKFVNSDNKIHGPWVMPLDVAIFLLAPATSNHNGLSLKEVTSFKYLIIYWISSYCISAIEKFLMQ